MPDPPAEQVASKREWLLRQIKNPGAEPDELIDEAVSKNASAQECRRILKKNLNS